MTQTTAERMESILRHDLDVDVIVSRGGDPHYNEADIVGVNIAAQAIAAEIDALTRERDEARAIADARVGDLMNANGIYIDELKAQLAEARAEVERLRPAAEAWEKLELMRASQKYYPANLGPEFREALAVYEEAAARARAAKEEVTK